VHTPTLTTLRRALLAAGLAALIAVPALIALMATPAFADSTPIGALPHPADKANVWRLARQVDPKILRQVSEADIGRNVVIIYQVAGKGQASIIFALTRGDTSSKALGTITHRVTVSS
jgi:hypothetical protein